MVLHGKVERWWLGCLLALVLAVISGCKPEEAKPGPVAVQGPVYHTDVASAIRFISENLAAQTALREDKPANLIPVDQFFNEHSAEGAAIAKSLQQQIVAAMTAAMPGAKFAPLNTQNVQSAQWVVLAGYANLKPDEAGKAGRWVRLKVALADVKSGGAVASVTTYLDASQFSSNPTRFSKEAPMYLTDADHKDRLAVLGGEKRASMGDGIRLRAQLSEAVDAYESEQYAEAESRFKRIIEAAPRNTAALSGLYQALWLQGKKADAEKVFGQLASVSIETGVISVRLLFKLSSTEFIDEGDLGQQYQVWLKAIANQVSEKKVCLDITGHASASGAADYNNKLSLSRASRIVTRMQQLNSSTKNRLKAFGKGASEAIVGTGANDSSDAIDRRVEFAVQGCG